MRSTGFETHCHGAEGKGRAYFGVQGFRGSLGEMQRWILGLSCTC